MRTAILLASLLIAAPVYAANILDDINAKIDQILQLLKAPVTPTPPVIVTCDATNSGGKFSVGDVVQVSKASGGLNIRTVPDINTAALTPFQPVGTQGKVACTRAVSGVQWVQVDYESGPDGWSRDTALEKVGPVVVVPPPPPPPPPPVTPLPSSQAYYIAPNGSDGADCSLDAPCLTLARVVPQLQAGQILIARAGTYNTGGFVKAGGDTALTNNGTVERPIVVMNYPGERVTFVRDLEGSGFTVEQVAAGVHAPTLAQCQFYATLQPGAYLPYPEKCWAGSPSPGYLYLMQDDTGQVTGPIFDLTNATRTVEHWSFPGINWDARGINGAVFASSTTAGRQVTANNISFSNGEMKNAARSCVSQPGASDTDAQGKPTRSVIKFYRMKIHHCGIPFDTVARKHPAAKFLHGFYGHIGGMSCEECEIFENAGGGFEPDGSGNNLINSYLHDNACLGAQLGGGDGNTYTGNIFYNNGCAEIQLLSGRGHTFRHNTLVAGPLNADLGVQITLRDSEIGDNIITGFKTSILSLQPWDAANRIRNNLIDGALQVGNGTIPPVISGNITAAPMLDANYKPQAGSPAIKAATDGGNIGAK